MELQGLQQKILQQKRVKRVKSIIFYFASILSKHHFRHTLKKHYNGKVYECFCGSVFAENHTLTKHQRVHSNEVMTCEVCLKVFKTEENFKIHWKKHHSEKHGPLPTNLPAKFFKNTRKLQLQEKASCTTCFSFQPFF